MKTKKTQRNAFTTIAEAKKSNKRRSTIEHNIQFDKGSEKFIVEYNYGTKNGKTHREHQSFTTLKEAREALACFKAEKAKGLPQNLAEKITFAECMREYVESARIERTTERGYMVIERRVAKTPLARKKVRDIRKPDIEDYINAVKQQYPVGNATINKDLDLIFGTLQYAVVKEYIKSNPANGFKRLKETRNEPKVLSLEELKHILKAVEETGDYRIIIPAYLGALQGMRRGEIIGLKWDMVSFEENKIKIRHTITQVGGEIIYKAPKTEESNRDLDIHESVKKILMENLNQQKERGAVGEYVVTNQKGKILSPTYLSKLFNKFIKKQGFSGVRFHDLRHTYATLAIQAGVNPLAVSGALGHSTLSTTLNIYVHSKALDGSKQVNSLLII